MVAQNKVMRFCFSCSLALAAAAALQGAGIPRPAHSVRSVVRPDRSGRLVRSLVVTARPVQQNVIAPRVVAPLEPAAQPEQQLEPPSGLHEAIDRIAQKHSLPPQLVHSVIRVESNYDPYAISSKGALGLMQLVPSTARRFGVSNVFNPVQNLEGGVKYLRYLLDLYRGSYPLALAAYNAGEGAVARYGGVPPYPETQSYLVQVARRLAETRAREKRRKPETETPAPGSKSTEGTNAIVEVVGPDGKIQYVTQR